MLVKGFLNVWWNGWFEVLINVFLVILDGVYNVDGMKVFVENCKMYLNGKKIVVVVGILKDKEYEKMIFLIKSVV